MENEQKEIGKYIKAKKRVDQIKDFYFHLIKFAMITILILLFKGLVLKIFIEKGVEDENILQWMEWNMLLIPIIWGLVLVVIGLRLFVFKANILKIWEEEQIKKYLEND
ncbi:2TM domain-containing protein [Maribacter polysiphoniae]|uniref:2TM domain-containing protein n=1 Tax=Maribacter polysiphoniae TaxID=429344 RepID=A0A316E1Y0_9FLAO|nr:2TM domain-containing protein [Maribacter polysiphoniae]MBD1261101.1 2TM domain-containing protein [Maribacter polysiphoniae]PWK23658.1 2TM domain-containing protein [Maribacter polysiphoniae]